jgi:AcrR family transcriptional regulator
MTTKQRILAIAIDELTAKGLAGLSLRAVGQKAGITPMAVYRHFADKAALLEALGAHALDLWQRRAEACAGLPLLEGFEAIATAFVDFALDEPALFDAAFVLHTRAERIYPDDFEAGRSPVIGGFARRLAEGQAAGLVRAGPPLELALAVWGVLQGLVTLHRSGRFNLSRPEFTALCLRSAARIYLKDDAR